MSGELLPDLLPRIRAASREVNDARDAYELAIRQRDELIVLAVDEAGISQREVALAAGVTKGRVIAILSNTPFTEVL